MLRAAYSTVEAQFRQIAKMGSNGPHAAKLLDEALALLRCLIFNRLEPISGQYINLSKFEWQKEALQKPLAGKRKSN